MKKLILLFVLISTAASAQIINFTDPNLKAALVDITASDNLALTGFDGNFFSGPATIDTNADGEIQVSETAMIKYLDIDYKNIANLDGLQYFTNLVLVTAIHNQLTTVDMMEHPSLMFVDLSENALTDINVLGVNNLTVLRVYDNQLTTLDVTDLAMLQSVHCSYNQLTTLDFHTNPVFYDLGCSHNNLSSINIQNGELQNTLIGWMWTDGWGYNPNLTVCADANEIDAVNQMLDTTYPTVDVPVIVCALQTDDFTASSTKIYPNPVQDFLHIESACLIKKVQVFDVRGRMLYAGDAHDKSTNLDFSAYDPGIYCVQIDTDTGTQTQKLIKK